MSLSDIPSRIKSAREGFWLEEPRYLSSIRKKPFTFVMFARTFAESAAMSFFLLSSILEDIPVGNLSKICARYCRYFALKSRYYELSEPAELYSMAEKAFTLTMEKTELKELLHEIWTYSGKLYDWLDSIPPWDILNKTVENDAESRRA